MHACLLVYPFHKYVYMCCIMYILAHTHTHTHPFLLPMIICTPIMHTPTRGTQTFPLVYPCCITMASKLYNSLLTFIHSFLSCTSTSSVFTPPILSLFTTAFNLFHSSVIFNCTPFVFSLKGMNVV